MKQLQASTIARPALRAGASLLTGLAVALCILLLLPIAALIGDLRMPLWALAAVLWLALLLLISARGAVRGGTWGMRVMRLWLGTGAGHPISAWRCLARILLGFVLLPLLPVSVILAYLDPHGRTLADMLCGTVVWRQARPSEQHVSRGFEILPLEDREHL